MTAEPPPPGNRYPSGLLARIWSGRMFRDQGQPGWDVWPCGGTGPGEDDQGMAVEVHVQGRVESGHLPDFNEAVRNYSEYAQSQGYRAPEVLLGLSGPMNTVRLVYRYDDLSQYEDHEIRAMQDREYGKLAGAMRFAEGTLDYAIFRRI